MRENSLERLPLEPTTMLNRRRMLMDLAERKLGPGATIRITREGWIAERTTNGKRARVTGKSRDILEWALNLLPDARQRA